MSRAGFTPPPYPYDRLAPLREAAKRLPGGVVDLSVGTPCDPPPEHVVAALSSSDAERGYPPSAGTPQLREAAAEWLSRRFGAEVGDGQVAACVGTKEFVAGLPHLLSLRDPSRDTVLYPAVSYPSYAMGAMLAGCRAVAVPVDDRWRIDLAAVDPDDARRALCLWVNTPGNPAGGLDDLGAAAAWGRRHGVPVFSDECYAEFTWTGEPGPSGLPGASILQHGPEGVVAVHSLSKRSNLAGLRVGFVAGDADLVGDLRLLRQHAGLMVPGPAQVAAAVALGDQYHVEVQRVRYRERLERLVALLGTVGIEASTPDGGFYLWVAAPDGDAWGLAEVLAVELGMLVSPGEFYGPDGVGRVRVAAVQPSDRLELLEERAAQRDRPV